MAKTIRESDAVLDKIRSGHKIEVEKFKNEIDIREAEIQKLNKQLETSKNDINLLTAQYKAEKDRADDLEAEMDLKSGENNRLREQVAEIEAAMQDLYYSRKGKGTLQIELESLKSENEHLLALLRETSEYCDFEDDEILKSSKTHSLHGAEAIDSTFGANKRARTGSADACKSKSKLNNNWIPTDAVRAIFEIRDKFNGEMTERAISQILYQLCTIWRNIMRAETEAQRKKMQAQIQDLRRQVVTKQAYDKGELMAEITRTKKALSFAEKQLINKNRIGGGKENNSKSQLSDGQYFSRDDVERSIKMVETL